MTKDVRPCQINEISNRPLEEHNANPMRRTTTYIFVMYRSTNSAGTTSHLGLSTSVSPSAVPVSSTSPGLPRSLNPHSSSPPTLNNGENLNIPQQTTTGTRILFAARQSGSDPAIEWIAPSARMMCGPRSTFEHFGRREKMLESGMRIVGIPAEESDSAVIRPENLDHPD